MLNLLFTRHAVQNVTVGLALAQVRRPFTLGSMTIKRTFPLLALMLLGAIACGGQDDSKNAPRVRSGIDESKPLNTLTLAEMEQLSQSVAETVSRPEVRESFCMFGAAASQAFAEAFGTEPEMSCEERVDTCLRQPPAPSTLTQEEVAQFASCTATVGQYEACTNAVISKIQEVFGAVTCDFKPEEGAAPDPWNFTECETLEQLCPSGENNSIDGSSPDGETPSGETIVE